MVEVRGDRVEDPHLALLADDARLEPQQRAREERAGHAAAAPVGEAQLGAHPAVDLRRGEPRLGGDHLGLGAGEVAHDAHRIASRVHRRAAAEVVAVADVARHRQRDAEARLDVPHAPELAREDDLAHARGERVVAPVERLDQDAPAALGCLGHLLRLGRVRRDRLLA